jgi:hypothetical protein
VTRSADEITTLLRDFDRHTVWHQQLKAAFDSCLRSIALAKGDGRITVVLGASGVGKERLAAELRSHLEATQGRRPTYAEVAPGSSTAPVSIGAVYDLILADLGAIGSHYVIATTRLPAGLPQRATKTQQARLVAIDNLLRLLNVPALILDEAQYLVAELNPVRQRTNLRAFSFLANRKSAPVVMLATFDLMQVIRSAPDVHRRIRLVRFERFRRAEQMPGFVAALADYDAYLSGRGLITEGFSLVGERVRLYQASFGCVGNLHNLLYEALADALHADHALSTRDFDQPERDLLPDRKGFERETLRLEGELDRLRESASTQGSAAPNDDSETDAASDATTAKAKRGTNSRPTPVGELKQIRHAAGEGRGLKPRQAVA